MCAKWSDDRQPDALISELEKIRTFDGEKLSYSNTSGPYPLSFFEAAITSAIDFCKALPSSMKPVLVSRCLFHNINPDQFNKTTIIRKITELEKAYLQRPFQYFYMITSISIADGKDINPINFSTGQVKFQFDQQRFKRNTAIQAAQHWLHGEYPTDYTPIAVRVSARSVDEAIYLALDTVDLMRSIWNIIINRSTSVKYTLGKRRPINKILLGPLHTLHKQNGKIINKWSYNPDYVTPGRAIEISKFNANFVDDTNHLKRKIGRSHHREIIVEALKNYARALDSIDYLAVFLELWSLLEHLTYTGRNSYKVTIRRASAIYKDANIQKEFLIHLMNSRNTFVHSISNVVDQKYMESEIYNLKRYVEDFIVFYITNPLGLKNQQDVSYFLDHPTDLSIVNNRLSLLRKMQKLRT